MATLQFLDDLTDLKVSGMAELWKCDHHQIPEKPGVYLLIAKPGIRFIYPAGKNPIYYIGQAKSLRRRICGHRRWHVAAQERNLPHDLYEMRHEYGAAFGGRYYFIELGTGSNMSLKDLEDTVLGLFARRYRAFPVANSRGAFDRIAKT